MERRGSHLNLTVDKHTERVVIPAEFSHLGVEQVGKLLRELPETLTIHVLSVHVRVCPSPGECGLSPECQRSQATDHQKELQWLPGEPAV